MNKNQVYNAILGNNPSEFGEIWPIYKKFLELTKAHTRTETYFLDKGQLINDFYRWLHESGQQEILAQIDRRSSNTNTNNLGRRSSDREGSAENRRTGTAADRRN